jgi:hypothetical protein
MLEVLADGTDVSEVVVLLDQAVEEPLLARPPHLSDLEGANLLQARLELRRVDLDALPPPTQGNVVRRDLPDRRKLDSTHSVQF